MAPGKELLICLGTFWDTLHANLKKAFVSVFQWQALLDTVRPKDRTVQEARPHRQASKQLPSGVTQCHTAWPVQEGFGLNANLLPVLRAAGA